MVTIRDLMNTQLLEFSDKGFKIQYENGEIERFIFTEDKGLYRVDNQITAELLISEEELNEHPMITNIEYLKGQKINLSDDDYEDIGEVAFFNGKKRIAEIRSWSLSPITGIHCNSGLITNVETGATHRLSDW